MAAQGLRRFVVIALGCTAGSAAFAGPQMVDTKTSKNVETEQTAVCDPRWYISIGGGGDFNIGTTRINDAQFTTGIPLFAFPGGGLIGFASADIKRHSFDDVYDNGYHIEGEVGYSLTQHLDVFGRFRYAHADATDRTRGSTFDVLFFNAFTATVPISSDFDDYDSWGGELGFRFYFLPRAAHFRPYVAISGGASHVDDIGIRTFGDFSAFPGGTADTEVFRGAFLDESWVGTGAAVLGLEYNFGCHFTIGVNGGVRYESRLNDDDSDLNTRGFTAFGTTVTNFSFANQTNNNSGDRWTAPVTGYLKFRF